MTPELAKQVELVKAYFKDYPSCGEVACAIPCIIAALEAADPVAEAVKWCADPAVYMSFWGGEWHLSRLRGQDADSAPTLPAAVAALKARMKEVPQ